MARRIAQPEPEVADTLLGEQYALARIWSRLRVRVLVAHNDPYGPAWDAFEAEARKAGDLAGAVAVAAEALRAVGIDPEPTIKAAASSAEHSRISPDDMEETVRSVEQGIARRGPL